MRIGINNLSIIMVLTGLSFGCQRNGPPADAVDWVFADSTAAADWIQRDTATSFFQQIGTTDMLLQMGAFAGPYTESRDSLLPAYRHFLARQVHAFTQAEEALLDETMHEAWAMVAALNPSLFPKAVRLVKISGAAYGPSVYYTRENSILIPANELHPDNRPTLLRVLLHELFHIYSRYHPKARRELYGLIGFTEARDSVLLPSYLRKHQLLNPDGVHWQQKIRLTPAGTDSSRVFFPILYADSLSSTLGLSFMGHLAFDFFAADSTAMGWQVQALPTSVAQLSDFHQKTGGNTDYIIHPDEILADNFVLLVFRASGYPLDIDERGEKVLDLLKEKLK